MTTADEVGRTSDCVGRSLSHLFRFDIPDGPICRICGARLFQDDWLDDRPCSGPIDLHQVVADLSGGAYLGREKRDELAQTLRAVIRRLT